MASPGATNQTHPMACRDGSQAVLTVRIKRPRLHSGFGLLLGLENLSAIDGVCVRIKGATSSIRSRTSSLPSCRTLKRPPCSEGRVIVNQPCLFCNHSHNPQMFLQAIGNIDETAVAIFFFTTLCPEGSCKMNLPNVFFSFS